MPQLTIRPSKIRRNDTTILAENLGLVEFNATETVLSETPVADFESTKKYLEIIGANQLDKEFNDAVESLEQAYQLQSLELQKQSNIAQQDALMQSGEGVLGKLGTGAAADFSGDLAQAQAQESQSAQLELTQQFADSVGKVSQLYEEMLTETFGELTAEGFSGITELNQMVDEFSMGVLRKVAENIGITNYKNDYDLRRQLVDAGMLKQVGDTTEFELTSAGFSQFAAVLTSSRDEFGGRNVSARIDSVIDNIAESYMATYYPNLLPGDSSYDKKFEELKLKWNEWMQKNMTAVYYSHLDLARYSEDGNLEIYGIDYNTEYANTDIPSATDKYIAAANITADWFDKYLGSDIEWSGQYKYISSLISDLKSGDVPDGSYFAANYGEALKAPTLYYYENGIVYETGYTLENLPDNFHTDSFYNMMAYTDVRGGKTSELWKVYESAYTGRLKTGPLTIYSQKFYYDANTKTFKKIKE